MLTLGTLMFSSYSIKSPFVMEGGGGGASEALNDSIKSVLRCLVIASIRFCLLISSSLAELGDVFATGLVMVEVDWLLFNDCCCCCCIIWVLFSLRLFWLMAAMLMFGGCFWYMLLLEIMLDWARLLL